MRMEKRANGKAHGVEYAFAKTKCAGAERARCKLTNAAQERSATLWYGRTGVVRLSKVPCLPRVCPGIPPQPRGHAGAPARAIIAGLRLTLAFPAQKLRFGFC